MTLVKLWAYVMTYFKFEDFNHKTIRLEKRFATSILDIVSMQNLVGK